LPDVSDFRELAGRGVEGRANGHLYKLGRQEWATPDGFAMADASASAWLSKEGQPVGWFATTDQARPGASAALRALASQGMPTEILSGDRGPEVRRIAAALGIDTARHGM